MMKSDIYCPTHSEEIIRISLDPYSQPRLLCFSCVTAMNSEDPRLRSIASFRDYCAKTTKNTLNSEEAYSLEDLIKTHEYYLDKAVSTSSSEVLLQTKQQIETWFQDLEKKILDELHSLRLKFLSDLETRHEKCHLNFNTFKQGLEILKENLLSNQSEGLPNINELLGNCDTFNSLDEMVKKINISRMVLNYCQRGEHVQDLWEFKKFLEYTHENLIFSRNAKNSTSPTDSVQLGIIRSLNQQVTNVFKELGCLVPVISTPEIWRRFLPSNLLTRDQNKQIMEWTEEKLFHGNLLYRGSQHGFTVQELNQRCQSHVSPLIMLIRVKENGDVIGAYLKRWPSVNTTPGESDAFLFNVTKNHKTKVTATSILYHKLSKMFTVGALKSDLVIKEPFSQPVSSSRFYTFPASPNMAQVTATSGGKFSIEEIEVFEVENLRRLVPETSEFRSVEGEFGEMFECY